MQERRPRTPRGGAAGAAKKRLEEVLHQARVNRQGFSQPSKAALATAAFEPTATPGGASRLTEFWRCPRAAHLRGLRLVPASPSLALQVGSVCHGVVSYLILCAEHGLTGTCEEALKEVPSGRYMLDAIAEAARIMPQYVEFWGPEGGTLGANKLILGVEYLLTSESFAYAGTQYTARLDALYLDYATSDLVVVDHKTIRALPSAPDEELAELYRTRQQFLGHSALVREAFGVRPLIMINWISKTKVPGFRRLTFRHTDVEIDAWAENMRQIRRLKLLERAAQIANYDQCSPGIGDPCWAFQFCHDAAPDAEERLGETYEVSPQALEFHRKLRR